MASSEIERFIEEIEPGLISYLAYRLGDRSEAEDLFQEACMRLVRAWPRVRTLEKPRSWVMRVAHNLVVDRLRRRSVEWKGLQVASKAERMSAPPSLPVQEQERYDAIQSALAELPEDQNEAVCQRIWGGMTWLEIGELLGVSDDTAARLFVRGVKTLGPKLTAFNPEQ
jgi:RNA polymerase sigma-70 factor (ECF subfamily)